MAKLLPSGNVPIQLKYMMRKRNMSRLYNERYMFLTNLFAVRTHQTDNNQPSISPALISQSILFYQIINIEHFQFNSLYRDITK